MRAAGDGDPNQGHDQTIVNGISRIGYMNGGKTALWVDEDMADVPTAGAGALIEKNKDKPFFLYFATHDIHVPRAPNPRFAGRSGLGPRGDVILQLDWCADEILRTLERLGLTENTLVIFTRDNGPVVDDGYKDKAVELLDGHKPAGPLRGGKYSAFDAGTQVPFVVCWPGNVKPGESAALISQIDFVACLAQLTGQKLAAADAPDSLALLDPLLGRSRTGRDHLVEQAGVLSLIRGDWKYIEPGKGAKFDAASGIELGRDTIPQLYDLRLDLGEKNNVARDYPGLVGEMSAYLRKIRNSRSARPR